MARERTLLALVMLAGIGFAGGSARAQDPVIVAALSVNSMERPPAPILLRGHDVLARVADLEAAGLAGFGGRREMIRGYEHVSLQSLAPLVRFEFDQRAIALRVTADPSILAGTRLDLSAGPPRPRLARDASAFFNYSLTLDDAAKLAAFGEAGASYAGALLFSGFSRRTDGTWQRGLSNFTYDDTGAMRRWVAGDVYASSGPLGSSLLLGGASVAREFSLDPYQPRTPLPRLAGAAQTPSQLEVYVDGRLVRQEKIAPGPFEIANLPATAGLGSVRTVIRDAFGRTQEMLGSTYVSPGLLARGLSDYQLAAGLVRPDLNQPFAYGEAVLIGRARRGLFDTLTAGGRVEARRGMVSGGLNGTWLTPLGVVDLGGALSTDHGVSGAAASASYAFLSRWANFGAEMRWFGPTYATATLHATDARELVQADVSAGVALGRRVSVGALAGADWDRAQRRRDRASLRVNLSLGGNLQLLLSAGISRAPDTKPVGDGAVFLSWAFGERSIASATYGARAEQNGPIANSGSLDLQRSLPLGSGIGYRVHAEDGLQRAGSATLQLQGEHGRLEGTYARAGDVQSGSVTAAGGLVLIDGSLFQTRPVDQGFALLQVPGVAGVPALLNNQEIGRTDSNGNLLVPDLQPYTASRLGIHARAVSLAYRVGETEQTVAAPFRGGALVRFDVRRLRGVTGEIWLLLPSGERAPAKYGELSAEDGGTQLKSPLGSSGRFFIEQISPGFHVAQVVYAGGVCRVVLKVPETMAPVQNLGRLTCEPPAPLLAARPTTAAGPTTLSGRLFVDENGDGRFEPGEPLLAGVELAAGDRRARTSADGRFELREVPAGAVLAPASPSELPAGFRIAGVAAGGDVAVRRPAAIKDLGISLILDLPTGPLKVQQLQAASIRLTTFLQGKALSRAEDASVQRLGTDVLDAPDLRVLLIVHSPAAAADAFAHALQGARGALAYLRGPAMVPSSRLIWTVAEPDASAPEGQVDVLLVRVPPPPPDQPRGRPGTKCSGATPCR